MTIGYGIIGTLNFGGGIMPSKSPLNAGFLLNLLSINPYQEYNEILWRMTDEGYIMCAQLSTSGEELVLEVEQTNGTIRLWTKAGTNNQKWLLANEKLYNVMDARVVDVVLPGYDMTLCMRKASEGHVQWSFTGTPPTVKQMRK
jgi:hypothetical protein